MRDCDDKCQVKSYLKAALVTAIIGLVLVVLIALFTRPVSL